MSETSQVLFVGEYDFFMGKMISGESGSSISIIRREMWVIG